MKGIDPQISTAIAMLIEEAYEGGYLAFQKEGGAITLLGHTILITHPNGAELSNHESLLRETFEVPFIFLYGKNTVSLEDIGILTRRISEHIETYAEFASDLGFALSPSDNVIMVMFQEAPKNHKMIETLKLIFKEFEGLNKVLIYTPEICTIWDRKGNSPSISREKIEANKPITKEAVQDLAIDLAKCDSIDDILNWMDGK